MAYFRVNSGLYSDPKVMSIPQDKRLAAIGLWITAGSWSVRYETNGYIPASVLPFLNGTIEQAANLVSSGLWSEVQGGWRFIEWRKSQDGDYRRNIKKSVRALVMKRDGFACVLCGSTENLSLDHIQRYRDDGPDTIENLRVLCMPCNLERG